MVNKYVFAGLGLLGMSEATILLASGTATALTLGAITIPAITVTSAAVSAAAVAGIGALVAAGAIAKVKLLKQLNNGKRSIDDANCLLVDNPDLFLTLAANNDRLGCGMRLVCELEAVPDDDLSEDEKLIVNLFGRGPEPVKFQDLDKPKAGFQYAAYVGATSGDCAKVFGSCPFDRPTMMQAFKEALNE